MKRFLFLILLLIAPPLSAQEYTSRYFHYNSYFDAPAPFTIMAATIDGADNNSMCLAGGGSTADTRGAGICINGNEATATGKVTIQSGNVSGSDIELYPRGFKSWSVQSTTGTDNEFVFGYSALANSVATIRGDRADASDDGTLNLCAGGACSTTRGSFITLLGDDVGGAGAGAGITYEAGTGTAGTHKFNTAGSLRWSILANGNISQDVTNGGGLVMSKANTGLTYGILHSDISGGYGTPPLYAFANTLALGLRGAADAAGPNLYLGHSRATDGSADTIIVNGDTLGSLKFLGADGAAFRNAAMITAEVDGAPGSSDMPGRLVFQTTPDGSSTLGTVLTLGNDLRAVFTGTVRTTATSIGWRVAAGANTACTTTCGAGKGCVFGQDTAALTYAIVDCANAAADLCICTTT